jgi:hypothetical protein
VPGSRFALDEDVRHDLAALLRSRGWDVDSAKELGRIGLTDPHVLARAAESGQTLITHNRDDFRALHEAWLTWRSRWEQEVAGLTGAAVSLSRHAGILILPHGFTHELAVILEAFEQSAVPVGERLFIWKTATGWQEFGPIAQI